MKTASWFTQLPDNYLRIGISRGTPRGPQVAGYRMFKQLAPGPWFNSVSPEEYYRRYRAEILARLDRPRVITQLLEMGGTREPVLLCFEQPNGRDWCHRAMAAEWLAEGLKRPVPEFGFEHIPQHHHRLMPASLRRAPIELGKPEDVAPFIGKSATIDGVLHTVEAADPNNPGQAIVRYGDGDKQFSTTAALLRRYFS